MLKKTYIFLGIYISVYAYDAKTSSKNKSVRGDKAHLEMVINANHEELFGRSSTQSAGRQYLVWRFCLDRYLFSVAYCGAGVEQENKNKIEAPAYRSCDLRGITL